MKSKRLMNSWYGGTGDEYIVSHGGQSQSKCLIRQIFPTYSSAQCPPMRNSALARIWERHVCIKTAGNTPEANC